MKYALILLVKIYQKTLSPIVNAFGPRCKYYPSCSHYAIDALRERGAIVGLGLTTWRLIRCNPFSHGGVDYVTTPESSITYNQRKSVTLGAI
jgi:hypothetical protein